MEEVGGMLVARMSSSMHWHTEGDSWNRISLPKGEMAKPYTLYVQTRGRQHPARRRSAYLPNIQRLLGMRK